MNRGFITLDRKFFGSWVWKCSDVRLRLFQWLLYRARWQDGAERVPVGGEIIEIRRGQLWDTRRGLAAGARIGVASTRTGLQFFEREGAISTQVLAQHGRLITITKYDEYQRDRREGSPATSPRVAQARPRHSPIRTRGTREQEESEEYGAAEPAQGVLTAVPIRDGVDRVLKAYPRTESRRTRPALARRVWKRKKLEPHTERILLWIEAMKATKDWQRGAVPGLQVFLNRETITEADPEPIEPGAAGTPQPGAAAWFRYHEERE